MSRPAKRSREDRGEKFVLRLELSTAAARKHKGGSLSPRGAAATPPRPPALQRPGTRGLLTHGAVCYHMVRIVNTRPAAYSRRPRARGAGDAEAAGAPPGAHADGAPERLPLRADRRGPSRHSALSDGVRWCPMAHCRMVSGGVRYGALLYGVVYCPMAHCRMVSYGDLWCPLSQGWSMYARSGVMTARPS